MRASLALPFLLLLLLTPGAWGRPVKARGPFLLVSLPALGTLTWRCDPAREPSLALGFRAFVISADSYVRLHVGRRTIARRHVVPAHAVRFPYVRSHLQQLDLVQGTEAGTLRAFVTVDFAPHGTSTYCWPYLPPRVDVRVLPRS